MNAIEVRDVRKVYRRYGRRKQFATLKSALLSGRLLSDLKPDEVFEALKGVSFDVAPGRTFGIVGRNGSGKSTMLKMIAGIGRPTSGTVKVNGRVSALIELGAGFHPEISGRENVFVNGMMLGLSRREIARRFDEIVAFAELEDFIDAPVKTYSSGMYMRLGFAVAIHVDPEVLLVDEVLAVGDEAFTHKCLDKLAEFRRRGRTLLLVTHQLEMVTRFCDEALWLDGGLARAQGDPKRVIDAYLTEVAAIESRQMSRADEVRARSGEIVVEPPADMFRAAEGRWGSREVEIVAVDLVGAAGQPSNVFPSGERHGDPARAARRGARAGRRRRRRDIQCRGHVLLRDEHAHRGRIRRRDRWRRRGPLRHRQPRSRRGDLQARCCGAPGKRSAVRLPPPALHLPRDRACQGGRHLPPAAQVDVLRRRAHEGSAVKSPPVQVSSAEQAAAFAGQVRARGGKVVFTNGVFDLLHPGHVRYLRDARALGDALIVAVNSDRSVRSNKGPGRPVNPEQERAELLLALAFVDAAVIFDEETPHAIVGRIQPDILVKGADWGEDNIVGRDIVEGRGGRVVRVELSPGHSTTELVNRIRRLE